MSSGVTCSQVTPSVDTHSADRALSSSMPAVTNCEPMAATERACPDCHWSVAVQALPSAVNKDLNSDGLSGSNSNQIESPMCPWRTTRPASVTAKLVALTASAVPTSEIGVHPAGVQLGLRSCRRRRRRRRRRRTPRLSFGDGSRLGLTDCLPHPRRRSRYKLQRSSLRQERGRSQPACADTNPGPSSASSCRARTHSGETSSQQVEAKVRRPRVVTDRPRSPGWRRTIHDRGSRLRGRAA